MYTKGERREGLGEDSRLSAFGELGWGKGENRNTGELLTQREMKARVGALEGKSRNEKFYREQRWVEGTEAAL